MRTRALKLFGLCAAWAVLALAAVNSGQVGSAQVDCTVTVQPGQSIQQAINSAAEGAVICLSTGTFQENIEIKKSLTLRGAGREQSQIKSKEEGKTVIAVAGDAEIRVALAGLTIAEARGFSYVYGGGIFIEGKTKAEIQDLQISGNLYGLVARDSAQVSLTNSQLSGNEYSGLIVAESARVSLTNSRLSGNGFFGLVVVGSAQVSLADSQVSENGFDGLFVQDSARVSLTNSRLSGNGFDGLVVTG